MAITESTIECTVARVDAQTGPVGGYEIELVYTTADSTTKLGGVGSNHSVTIWMNSGQPAVGDLIDLHLIAS